jgi:nanoRNase/pAp phosphatase (c-di-AMP/oligoRNAs hydrolase)
MGMFRLSAAGHKKLTGAKMPKGIKERQEKYNRDHVKAMREKLKNRIHNEY